MISSTQYPLFRDAAEIADGPSPLSTVGIDSGRG
jgi:hypothetical protein